jgi:hypothetical protein
MVFVHYCGLWYVIGFTTSYLTRKVVENPIGHQPIGHNTKCSRALYTIVVDSRGPWTNSLQEDNVEVN